MRPMIMCVIALAGCGRIGFDPGSGDGGSDSTGSGDDGGGGGDGGVDAAPASSCVALAASCGPTGTDDCCSSTPVPGGTFFRSYDNADGLLNDMTNPATVGGFRLDNYLVTVGRFRRFVDAGGGVTSNAPPSSEGGHANIAGSGWDSNWNSMLVANTGALIAALNCSAGFQTWTNTIGSNEDRPINCMSWYEAMAFCVWDGGYLATEAEYNYAAAGGSEQRAYPWSSPPTSLVIDGTRASYYVNATVQCIGDGVNGCALTDLVRVGSKPAGDGRWTHSDLGGNLWEWVLDWWATSYSNPCIDCANLTTGSAHVVRGGYFSSPPVNLRAGGRLFFNTAYRNYDVGFRCARAP